MTQASHSLSSLDTPAAIVDVARMQGNIQRMQQRMDTLGVALRPHVKTSKCTPVAQAQLAAGARGVTVSTLKEATQFFEAGITDILYAVGMAEHRLPAALALRRQGCNLKIITDSVAGASAIARFGGEHGEAFEVWIEVDTDGHRSGIKPEEAALLDVGTALHTGGMKLGGVMTHAGSSYELDTPQALAAMAEQERAGCVRAAERLRAAGLPCPGVSVGSTPTALSAQNLQGVTEVRAGVYVFFDLVMHNIGVCRTDELALSVLTTVIGHQADKGWVIVDAGWMAMSRDRGTRDQARDFGYGQVCTLDGEPLDGYTLIGANQEHGIMAPAQPGGDVVARFPIGTRLRVLPNHACATGAQYPQYQALQPDGTLQAWDRAHGW
ncbi:DSD1 family PLP-dependent enzyme [Bordetella petrii]|uniref:DSD1 family PLP-dependent enzyme n=1 Tax=Bordetella petrii TaxID=94624 RepID=UPI001E3A4A07|nr:DSD1 family PLP-dependent enzyme [Bordetella petrii]MCD0505099.1 DSD1 family PLP-dependent enzyme [Bordetella petrii]